MKLFKNIFGKKENNEVISTQAEIPVVEKVEIDESLFSNLEPPSVSIAKKNRGLLDEFNEVLARDHYTLGYRAGYGSHDIESIARYKEVLISEASDILIAGIRKIDIKLLEFNDVLERSESLNATLYREIKKNFDSFNLDREYLLDKLESAREGLGSIKRALLEYEQGFTQGFIDSENLANI